MNIVEFQKKAGEDFPFPLEQNFETMLYILSGKQIEFFKVVEVLRDKVFSGIPIQREVIAYHVGNAAWFIMNGYSCSKDTSEDWNLPDIEIPVEMLNAGKDDAILKVLMSTIKDTALEMLTVLKCCCKIYGLDFEEILDKRINKVIN